MSGDHEADRGFDAPPSLTLDGATVYFPNGLISNRVEKLNKNKIENVTGAMPTFAMSNKNDRGFEMFGKFTYTIKDIETLQEEGVHYTLMVNKGADVAFTINDLSSAKTTFSCVVDGLFDIRGLTGKIVDMIINPGGEAIIAKDSKVTLLGGTIKRVALAGSGVSAAAAGEPGKLILDGSLTIPDGAKLTIEDVNSIVKQDGEISVLGKIGLPDGTTAVDMKLLALGLGIHGNVFEMGGETYNDMGEKQGGSGGGGSGGGGTTTTTTKSSSSGCSAGAFAPLALAAVAAIYARRKRG